MTTYAIGDIQGCFLTFQKLLEKISFKAGKDKLWLVGDLVNRGPRSLEVLRWCIENQNSLQTVLGNHDIHLLCRYAGVSSEKPLDSLDKVLQADDAKELIDWLRQQPYVHHERECFLVHAGFLPAWTKREILQFTKKAQEKLSGKDWKKFLKDLRHSEKPDELMQALRIFTQIRMVNTEGETEFKFKGSPDKAPEGFIPWFEFPERKTAHESIIFGHWAALGLLEKDNIFALDSGCVWGKELTALCLEDRKVYQQKMID